MEINESITMPPKLKTGPKTARNIAKKAAVDIRLQKFDTIQSAANKYFPVYKLVRQNREVLPGNEEDAEEERFKNFCKYIADELKSGPKSMHVFRVLSRRTKNQRKQPEVKKNRTKQIIKDFNEVLKK